MDWAEAGVEIDVISFDIDAWVESEAIAFLSAKMGAISMVDIADWLELSAWGIADSDADLVMISGEVVEIIFSIRSLDGIWGVKRASASLAVMWVIASLEDDAFITPVAEVIDWGAIGDVI
jgi:hypothetical protein